jgi:hypothetical protein
MSRRSGNGGLPGMLFRVHVILRSPTKRRHALLRNRLCGHHLKTHFSRLCANRFFASDPGGGAPAPEYRRVVLLLAVTIWYTMRASLWATAVIAFGRPKRLFMGRK